MFLEAICMLISALSGPVARAADLELPVSTAASEISIDPSDPAWRLVPAVTIPLWPQSPAIPPGAVQAARVQALSSPRNMYFRLEWEDRAVDDDPSTTRGVFDSAALEFPAQPEASPAPLPYMGDPENALVLWVWSSAAQKEISGHLRAAEPEASRKRPTTPVESLQARGPGTSKPTADQPVQGRGVWKDGRWRVVFRRGAGGTPPFPERTRMYVAVAVWDAGVQPGGLESISAWQTLVLPGAPAAPPEDSVARGRRDYFRYGCAACHGKDGLGPPAGKPWGGAMTPLAWVKGGFTREEMVRVILNGGVPEKADKPGRMARSKKTSGSLIGLEEAEAMTDYLFSLAPDDPGQQW